MFGQHGVRTLVSRAPSCTRRRDHRLASGKEVRSPEDDVANGIRIRELNTGVAVVPIRDAEARSNFCCVQRERHVIEDKKQRTAGTYPLGQSLYLSIAE